MKSAVKTRVEIKATVSISCFNCGQWATMDDAILHTDKKYYCKHCSKNLPLTGESNFEVIA